MAMDREKERDSELESSMYTNCLLLGLDTASIGLGGAGWNRGVGNFRHSNPRLGEKLLHFLLSSLRGPAQSAKDFDRVWPISDSSQSRDFRKIVQSILSELESKGALPRNNARVSSLATCCGPRFVELLWQLSVHALREVHRRTFSTDVSSNPLPALLTDASYLNAAALVPVTKARIALERRKFLKNANVSDHKQAAWINLANEMTSEFRELHAEEAYLQQELEKLQEIRNKAKLDCEFWDDRISSSSVQNSLLVSKASRLWDSLLSRKNQHEALVSGPIEDLITHREHRYRISGSALAAAINLSSLATPISKILSVDNSEQNDSSHIVSRADDKAHHTVDVAEILRRWTHALQHIHKQTLTMEKVNDGEDSGILNCIFENGHAESLAATLSEHQQHLVSIQGLANQLKAAVPALQNSIKKLAEEVKDLSPISHDEYQEHSLAHIKAQCSGRTAEPATDEIIPRTTGISFPSQIASNKPSLKLPQLFNPSPNWLRHVVVSQHEGSEISTAPILALDSVNVEEDSHTYAQNLRRSIYEAALSHPSPEYTGDKDKASSAGSEHFFIPFFNSFSEDVAVSESQKEHQFSFHGSEESLEEVFSPSYFKDEPDFDDCYEDLLAPLSETDAALMETSSWLQHNLPTGIQF